MFEPASGAPLGLRPIAPELGQPVQQRADTLIRAIQEELRRNGYRPGPADGMPGTRTRNAIRAYQKKAGMPADGMATKELLEHLRSSATQAAAVTSGSTNIESPRRAVPEQRSGHDDLVSAVQRELRVRGYLAGALDGVVGSGTRSAVRAFQRDAGLPVTGDVDRRLLAELRVIDPNIKAVSRP